MKSLRSARALRSRRWPSAVMALAMPLMLSPSRAADARAGRRRQLGLARLAHILRAAATTTAPNAAQPMQRTMTQPGAQRALRRRPARRRLLQPPRHGLLGGLAAGFLGAGLLGMLFGGGLFSGLGGLSSIFGLILQLGLIVLVVRFAMSWWRRRNAAPAYASAAATLVPATPSLGARRPMRARLRFWRRVAHARAARNQAG